MIKLNDQIERLIIFLKLWDLIWESLELLNRILFMRSVFLAKLKINL